MEWTGCCLPPCCPGWCCWRSGICGWGHHQIHPLPGDPAGHGGIAVIIFASQLKELLGSEPEGKEPGAIIPKLTALAQALPTLNIAAAAVTLVTVGVILGVRGDTGRTGRRC